MRGHIVVGVLVLAALLGGSAPATASKSQDTRPSISPISATFDEATRATTYRATLTWDRAALGEPEWRWDFTRDPADPDCGGFIWDRGAPPNVPTHTAIFRHGDESGCKHTGVDHNVDIEVAIAVGGYTCNAKIHGTTTHVGPEPELCFRATPPPTTTAAPPTPSAPPSVPFLSKRDLRDLAIGASALSATAAATAFGAAVVPSPDPFTKGAAVVCAIASVGLLLQAVLLERLASDPPDPNYRRRVKPVFPRVAHVRAGGGVTAVEAAAANALLDNSAWVAGYNAALLTALERAQGAYAAKNRTWDHTQSRDAAAFARAEAALLDARPALERRLRQTADAAGSRSVSAADVKRALNRIGRTGLPAREASLLRSLGVPTAALRAFAAQLAKVAPASAAGPVAARIATPAAAKVHTRAARSLRQIAASLARR